MSTPNRALLYMLTIVFVALCLIILLPGLLWAYEFKTNTLRLTLQDEIVHVLDGDTFHLPEHDIKIRLGGIDAPETRQVCERANGEEWDCAGAAREELRSMLHTGPLVCYETGADSYGRKVMRCESNDEDIGTHLVRGGWAWHWPKYSSGGYKVQLTVAQQLARFHKLGVWQGDNVEAWVWRDQQRRK